MNAQSEARVSIYVIITAGGSGTRMGTALPKQFLPLAGKPVLAHTLAAFREALPEAKLIVVLPADQLSYMQMVLQAFPDRIDLELTTGGATRFDSVKAGLALVPAGGEEALVLVHDGVRALVDTALIRRVAEAARTHGSAIPVIPVTDSIREVTADGNEPRSRERLRIIQTPQGFRAGPLLGAFEQPYSEEFTDEATVWESFTDGIPFLVEGSRRNIKITTPEDLLIAEAFLNHGS